MSNKFDDGSQAWFDAQLRIRAQQRYNNKSQNPLDRRVAIQDPAAKQAEIHDPYIRELVAKRAQQPHYGPIPLEKEVKTSVDMEAIARQQAMLQQTSGVNPLGDADLDIIFNKGRQQPHQHPLPGQQHQQYPQPQQSSQHIVLREGYPVYRAIQQAFGNTFILAREVGVVNHQLANQPFVMKGLIQAYVVPLHQQQINIQEIQRNPHLLSPLVEVHAPPMASLGPLLVPREAVVAPGQYAGGRQMITDARQHHAPQQPQHYYPNHNGRGIIKG